jgi:hypothetical protein
MITKQIVDFVVAENIFTLFAVPMTPEEVARK